MHPRAVQIALLIVLILALLPASPLPVRAQGPCDGLVPPRLSVGAAARVLTPYGLSLKNEPMTGASGALEVGSLPFGAVVTVLDGPRCNYGYRWWQVQTPGGLTGWAAEGDSADYYMEPVTIGLTVFQRRDEGARLAHYFVTPDGSAQPLGSIAIPPLQATPREAWQQVEIDRLGQALETLRATCPDRLAGTPWENVSSPDEALALPLPALEYDFYPAPDGSRIVLVRHLHLRLPRCDTVVPERIGISTVSVIGADGSNALLFPFPQHGSIPASEDRYAPDEPSEWNVTLDEVVWSPHGRTIAFVAAYRDQCGANACYRFHIYVWNLDTGQLYAPGEGRHVGWTSGGEGINFFRLFYDADNVQRAHLYTARPDGSARQEIWLPGGAVYVSDSKADLGYPWNDSGTRVMVGNAGTSDVMLLNVADRAFTSPIVLPDIMLRPNRLAVHLVQGESVLLWATIRGDFVTQ
ncbi:MAG: hypothetical protein JW910_21080, partial [Anaerolineae bacterium]|nr:hypothetical protein [Anaerolineae bacterium]